MGHKRPVRRFSRSDLSKMTRLQVSRRAPTVCIEKGVVYSRNSFVKRTKAKIIPSTVTA